MIFSGDAALSTSAREQGAKFLAVHGIHPEGPPPAGKPFLLFPAYGKGSDMFCPDAFVFPFNVCRRRKCDNPFRVATRS